MTREEMNDKMVDLMNATTCVNGIVVFDNKAIELVKEIADWARETNFYKNNRAESEAFFDVSATPTDIWAFILQKIIGAPTTVHRDCAIAAHMPALEAAIMREAEDG